MTNLSTGYGTYVTAALIAAATVAHRVGWLDDATYQMLLALFGAGGLTLVRAAVSASDARIATGQAVIAEHIAVPPPTIKAEITDPAGVPAPAKTKSVGVK